MMISYPKPQKTILINFLINLVYLIRVFYNHDDISKNMFALVFKWNQPKLA